MRQFKVCLVTNSLHMTGIWSNIAPNTVSNIEKIGKSMQYSQMESLDSKQK